MDIKNFKWTREPAQYKISDDKITFGIYACSPEDSSFKAVFSDFQLLDCQWKAHDGQQPD